MIPESKLYDGKRIPLHRRFLLGGVAEPVFALAIMYSLPPVWVERTKNGRYRVTSQKQTSLYSYSSAVQPP